MFEAGKVYRFVSDPQAADPWSVFLSRMLERSEALRVLRTPRHEQERDEREQDQIPGAPDVQGA